MSIARLVASMKAAGCSAEQIGVAVLTYSEGGERSSAAIRQARYRAKKKGLPVTEGITRDVTVTRNGDAERDVSEAPLACAYSIGEDISNIPPEKPSVSTPKGEKTKSEPRSRGVRLAEKWLPDDGGRSFAVETLGSNSAARAEMERFRDYWLAKAGPNALKADWDATWRNWVRKAAENARGPPNVVPLARNGKQSVHDALKDFQNGFHPNPDDDLPAEDGGEIRGNPHWLLPPGRG